MLVDQGARQADLAGTRGVVNWGTCKAACVVGGGAVGPVGPVGQVLEAAHICGVVLETRVYLGCLRSRPGRPARGDREISKGENVVSGGVSVQAPNASESVAARRLRPET